MTAPLPPSAGEGAILSQILLKQAEMGIQLAVISEQLRDLPDHEERIRSLETARAKVFGGAVVIAALVSAAGTWVGLLIRH